MRKKINAKLKMYSAVLEVCRVHEANWAQVPGFVSALNEFETELIILKNNSSKQESKLKGVSDAKFSKLDELYDRLLLVQSALAIHAKNIGNSELLVRNTIFFSDLKHLSIARIDLFLNIVVDDLNEFGPALVEYGITPEILEQTYVLIEEGRIQNTRPRMAIIERKLLTSTLDQKVNKLDEILKFRLDKLMRLFKKNVPDFYDLYFNARVVIEIPSKSSGSHPPHEPDDGL